MKRVKRACLCQTIFFETPEEYEAYKSDLDRKHVKYVIDDEQSCGSVTVKIRKQYNNYDCAGYID